METFFVKFLASLFLIGLFQIDGCKGCSEKERIGLLKIKSFFLSISDEEYADYILTSWVDDPMSDCCGWERVQCNATTQEVTELSLNWTRKISSSDDTSAVLNFLLFLPFQELQSLDLSGNYFEGWDENKGLPKLRNLKELHLGWNHINGYFESQELSNLRNLEVLDLSFNAISGIRLTNLTKLEVLNLHYNEINRSLTELSKLRNLKALDVGGNHLYGSLESQGICELKNLVELDFTGNNLKGSLPQCLNNLTSLKLFDISYNQISGNLPSVVANLTSLEYLDLSDNNFEGSFSLSSLVNHSKLEVLQVSTQNNRFQLKTENWFPTFQLKVFGSSYCNINGTIPKFLQRQHNLKFLDLSHNKLVGNFPTWLLQNNTKLIVLCLRNNSLTGIIQLPNSKLDLLHLDLSSNSFTDKLPQNLGTILPKLHYMDMSRNSFEGNIPSSIAEIKGLSLMDFSRNNFFGELSEPFFIGCLSLQWLDLSKNNFYGNILPKYMNLTQLKWLYLDNNHFNGKINDGLLNSTALKVLDISNNKLSGHVPSWIGNFSDLAILLMSKNCLEGSIPVQLNNLKFLRILDISENNLSGSMASSLNLSFVVHLYMQNNALGGSIPNSLFGSSNLMTLDLRDNNFFGRIPHQIIKYSDLRVLLLGGNQLQGHIPNQLCQLQKLGILDLSRNSFSGSIPSCFTDALFWTVGKGDLYGFKIDYSWAVGTEKLGGGSIRSFYNSILDLGQDGGGHAPIDQRVHVQFQTKNRYELYNGSNLNYMAGLDLSCNELTGEIPSEIGELQNIRALNLSHNFLSGDIPKSLSNLKMIESLDLSHNKLSGQIPPQLVDLNYLSEFNVSCNYLFGPIPDKGQFATFDDSSYTDNSDLCGETINRSCTSAAKPSTTSIGAEDYETAVDMVSFTWSFGASYLTFILGTFAILWVNSYWRRLWFFFVEACVDWCYYWLVKCVYFFRDHVRRW